MNNQLKINDTKDKANRFAFWRVFTVTLIILLLPILYIALMVIAWSGASGPGGREIMAVFFLALFVVLATFATTFITKWVYEWRGRDKRKRVDDESSVDI